MQARHGRLVLSPTDLNTFLACPHATSLDAQVAFGLRARPQAGLDEQLALIAARGLAHERAYRDRLTERGLKITQVSGLNAGPDATDLRELEEATVAAMRAGVDVVYQGAFFDGTWVGYADFLIRRDGIRSVFGDFAYDLVDTKLARHASAAALLQLATYARRLESVQGAPPRIAVVTGDGVEWPWRLEDIQAYARHASTRLREFLSNTGIDGSGQCFEAGSPVTEAVPVGHCNGCRWLTACSAGWAATDDLSLVAGLTNGQRAQLRDAGILTATELATFVGGGVVGVGSATFERLRRQARLQVAEREGGGARYELLPHLPGQGLARLPAPDPGDLYLDFEGDPFAGDGRGREYLAGLLDRRGDFLPLWAHDDAQEAAMVAELLGLLVARWREFPGMHVYHYASYEQNALKRLTGLYGVGEADLDALLRGGRFVDLYQSVRQGLVIGKGSYSLKQMEDLYWGHVRHAEGDAVADALSSVVEYERWLADPGGNPEILGRIADYNREDVRSTLALHDWLEERRAELDTALRAAGEAAVARPGDVPDEELDEPEGAVEERLLAEELLAAQLPLAAGLIGWHRREDRPEWWDYFRRAELSDDELVDDGTAIGRVGPPVQVGEKLSKAGRATSKLWRYEFPAQPCKVEVGKQLHCVDERVGCGTVQDVDTGIDLEQDVTAGAADPSVTTPPEGVGWVVLSRAARLEPATPRGLGPAGPLNTAIVRDSIARQARAHLAGARPLGIALMDRVVPADLTRRPGESATDAVIRVGMGLDGQVLAVQGPPGAGKTYAASHLIGALLDAGRSVGVAAQSHAVIRNLLDAVGRPALHKVSVLSARPVGATKVVEETSVRDVEAAILDGSARLVGGTAWLWAREAMADSVDVLVVDEAGQYSLANAMAAAGAARAMVLLGDPQQLTQPTKAEHPDGAGVSALGHLIGDRDVIGADRGLFLDVTYRMHPRITEFVSEISYDGMLRSKEGLELQRIVPPAGSTIGEGWPECGLAWAPVVHVGMSQDNPLEAAAVAQLVRRLLPGSWVDDHGVEHALTVADVLVVAPYNAHVARVRAAVPDGVRVGTVDKFQGQEAPVVIYTTASSSAADAPRGLGFLYDVHRLNVAVSRARALAIWVGSPALLDAPASTAEQVRQINAWCAFADAATRLPPLG
ncbi:MAG: TM0106 family RecB-like putative nuclease [Dermatophilaceae bacterium]